MSNQGPQFSILAMMAAIAMIALAVASLTVVSPPWLPGLLLYFIMFASPSIAMAGIVYGRGWSRAFAIGSILPLVAGFGIAIGVILDGGWGPRLLDWADQNLGHASMKLRFPAAILWPSSLLAGMACVVA